MFEANLGSFLLILGASWVPFRASEVLLVFIPDEEEADLVFQFCGIPFSRKGIGNSKLLVLNS